MKKGAKAINIANFFMQLMSKTLDYIYIYIYIYIYFNKLHTYDFLSSTCIITIFRIIQGSENTRPWLLASVKVMDE